jgi:hypothetical protein
LESTMAPKKKDLPSKKDVKGGAVYKRLSQ